MQMIFPRTVENSVNEGEIVFAFDRFYPVPTDSHENGIEVRLDEFWPDRVHIFETG